MGRLLADVAESLEYCERSYLFHSVAEFRIADPRPRNNHLYTLQAMTASVRNFRITDAIFDAEGSILCKDGDEITDTRYLVPDVYKSSPGEKTTIQLKSEFDYILGYNRGYYGYHHWLMQCLPAIDWGLRQKRDRPARLVLPKLASWQEDMLNLLGWSNIPRVTIEPGKYYKFPRVDYAEYLNGKATRHVSLTVYQTARRMLAKVPSADGHSRILFVSFPGAYYGSLTNETEVMELLRHFGAVIVSNDLPTDVRINLFRNAEVVVGPFGPGLADILFCRPGALLWEWIPDHHQNPAINRLAQSASLDYWGDICPYEDRPDSPRQWSIDLHLLRRRLSEISERMTHLHAGKIRPVNCEPIRRNTKPLEELMLAFESLGESCDLGLMQRNAGADPLGLFRFSGLHLDQLLQGLATEFEGVGDPENFNVVIAGEPPNQEYMIADRSVGGYHTFISPQSMTEQELRLRQAKYLTFLRRKILEDLKTGEKIWVWKEAVPSSIEHIHTLHHALRRFGPNRLMWVTLADSNNPPGKAEKLAPSLIRGYVRPRPPQGSDEPPLPVRPWFEVCEQAYMIWHPEAAKPELVKKTDQPKHSTSAMDILRQGPAQIPPPVAPSQAGWFSKFRSTLLLRR